MCAIRRREDAAGPALAEVIIHLTHRCECGGGFWVRYQVDEDIVELAWLFGRSNAMYEHQLPIGLVVLLPLFVAALVLVRSDFPDCSTLRHALSRLNIGLAKLEATKF